MTHDQRVREHIERLSRQVAALAKQMSNQRGTVTVEAKLTATMSVLMHELAEALVRLDAQELQLSRLPHYCDVHPMVALLIPERTCALCASEERASLTTDATDEA